MNTFYDIARTFAELFVESAPWLMLGLLVAGLMKAFVPTSLLARHLGGRGVGSTVKAAFIGAPLPLCSCGVIPAALGLRRSGASKNATVSFLISTPETGVDSISISYALLGPFMAIIRPIAAICSAITAGLLVGRAVEEPVQQMSTETASAEKTSCCSSEQAPEVEGSSCCASKSGKTRQSTPLSQRLGDGVRFTFVDLVEDIAPWLLIGLALAALIQVFVPTSFLTQWGGGFLAFAVMAVIGVPMYICATASTPIAAGLLFSGVSPGAVLVFMLAGPATNMATMGLVWKELGRRALAAYLTGVVVVAFAFGYFTNWAADYFAIDFEEQVTEVAQMVPAPIAITATVVLALLMVRGLWAKYRPQPAAACH